MEIGRVKCVKENRNGQPGWYGFLLRSGGGEIFFGSSDYRRVIYQGAERVLQRPQLQNAVRQPPEGEEILFTASSNKRGGVANPWCFKNDWDTAQPPKTTDHLKKTAAPPPQVSHSSIVDLQPGTRYRFVSQREKGGNRQEPSEIWQGTTATLSELFRLYPHNLPAKEVTGRWIYHYFFQQQNGQGEWEACDRATKTAKLSPASTPQLVNS